MISELFVVTSYHHILTAIAKKYVNQSTMDILISNRSTGDAYWELYIDKFRLAGWFRNIFYFDEQKKHPPSPIHPIATYKYELGDEERLISQVEGLDLTSYDMIYLIDDKMFLGSTVVRKQYPFHLCEDTVLTYQMMKRARSSKVMSAPYNIICPILKLINYWHPVFGYGVSCKAIETTSSEGLPRMLPKQKIKVVDRMELIYSIPQEEKDKLCEIFLDKGNIDYMRNNSDSVMIMTCPLVRDRMDYPKQIDVVNKLMKSYHDSKFIIKPHPRDDTDYKKVFPDTVVLKSSFPSEVFSFLEDIEIQEIVSVGSTSVNSCTFARKKRMIMLNELDSLVV